MLITIGAGEFLGVTNYLHDLSGIMERDKDKPVPVADANGKIIGAMRLWDAPCKHVADPSITEAMENFIASAEKLNAYVSVIAAQALMHNYHEIPVSRIAHQLEDIALTHVRELSNRNILFIDTLEKSRLYEQDPSEFWSQAVWDQFGDYRHDMVESMRCFALDRHTACVYHLLQVVEGGLREFARKIQVSGYKKPRSARRSNYMNALEWSALAQKMSDKLASQRPKSKTSKTRLRDRRTALDRFENLRENRNRVSHPDETEFTEQEAKEFMDHVPGFMCQVARCL